MQDIATKADEIAGKVRQSEMARDFDSVRDLADQETGGDLDCFQLDMLTDSVLARLNG